MMERPVDRIKAQALALGFTKVGVAEATHLDDEGTRLREWLARGYHGTMAWMSRAVERRVDPSTLLPGARSVVAVALNYYTDQVHPPAPGQGKISRYAWGDDYHDIVGSKLQALLSWMQKEYPGSGGKIYVDTGPVMDKVWAQRAGIGWEGKHTNVITQEMGSWVFLGEVITTLALEPDEPAPDHCGTCTLCIEACPTQAIVEPYVLDANLCISYLTIEHRGEVAPELAGAFGGWIYGCDICQDVCPWNQKFSGNTGEPGFAPREGNLAPELEEWATMTQEQFSARFRHSPVKRTKHGGLMRNVGIALEGERNSQPDPTKR